jgi:hypothetical protein
MIWQLPLLTTQMVIAVSGVVVIVVVALASSSSLFFAYIVIIALPPHDTIPPSHLPRGWTVPSWLDPSTTTALKTPSLPT